jgi:hypothetical protein
VRWSKPCPANTGARSRLPAAGNCGPGRRSPALSALLASANIEPAYVNYCLKGSQSDFVDNTGLDIRLGNSVTEDGFVATSSCMTCHGRAAFDQNGQETSSNGFTNVNVSPPIGPLGALLPTWYWNNTGQPPVVEGASGLVRVAHQLTSSGRFPSARSTIHRIRRRGARARVTDELAAFAGD